MTHRDRLDDATAMDDLRVAEGETELPAPWPAAAPAGRNAAGGGVQLALLDAAGTVDSDSATNAAAVWPDARVSVMVANTGGRVRARLEALTDVLTAYGVTPRVTTSPHVRFRDGSQELTIHGRQDLIAPVAELTDQLTTEMETAAAAATRAYGQWLRDQAEPDHTPSDRPGLRRTWRRDFLRAWGRQIARRIIAHRSGQQVPRPGRPIETNRHRSADIEAWLAVNQLPGALLRTLTGEAASEDTTTAYVPLPNTRNDHRDQVRAEALAEITTSYGVETSVRAPGRGTWRSLRIDGRHAVVAHLAEHVDQVASELDRAAAAAARAYGAWQRRQPREYLNPGNHAVFRQAWRSLYMTYWAARYAARVRAALAGRPGAAAPADDGPATEAFCAVRHAYADVDQLDPAPFVVAAELVRRSASAGASPAEHLVIVPCGRAKLDRAAPAGQMYTGSYHRACRRAADALTRTGRAGRVLILSAKYGLLDPAEIIEPYELRAGQRGAVTGDQLRAQAARRSLHTAAHVTVIGGRDYVALARAVWPHAQAPLTGTRGIGDQLARLAAIAAPPADPASDVRTNLALAAAA